MSSDSLPIRSPWLRASVRAGLVVLTLLIAISLAFGWVVIIKFQGSTPAAGAADSRLDQTAELRASLTRSGYASQGTLVEAMLASSAFFRLTNRPEEAAKLGADKMLVFVANETVHTGDLPRQFAPILRLDGDALYVPSEVSILTDAVHHRTTVIRFADVPAVVAENSHSIELLLPATATGSRTALLWTTPLIYPESLAQPPRISVGLFLTLATALLAAISPCLLQLTAFYLPTLAGVSMDAREHGTLSALDRGRVLGIAFLFVAGFTIPYTLGGALIGGMGQVLAERGWLNPTGPIVITAGVIMVLMAGLVAYRSRAPLVCKLPLPAGFRQSQRVPFIETFVSGFAIATGCVACFGGAILGVLLTYTGLMGSATLGAVGMFLFSMGIAIPFLLAAWGITWVLPVAVKLQRLAPMIGLVSSGVMLVFGLIMATGNFHIVSGWLRTFALF